MNKKQKGFTAIEGLLIVLTLAVIGFGGYYVWNNQHKTKATVASSPTTSSSSSTKSTTTAPDPYAGWKTYTSADGVYTISFPNDWQGDACAANNTCQFVATGPFDNWLSPTANPSWQAIYLNHQKTAKSPRELFNSLNGIPNPYNTVASSSTQPINGYSAYFARLMTSGLEDDYFVIAHNGVDVLFQMPVQDGTNNTRNTVPLVPIFKQIANSIKFHN